MALLPNFQSSNQDLQLMQSKWSAILNPVIINPLNSSSILKNVQLTVGVNSIPHLLGRPLQGWFIVRLRGPASIYDLQDSNQLDNYTLKLNSDAAVSVDLAVF